MDASKPSMTWNSENPSMIQPSSSPPPYQDSSFQSPSYSAQPPYVSGFDQQPNQEPYPPTNWQPFSMAQQQPGQPGIFQLAMPNQQEGPVNDYFSYSIFTMVCCFLPLGIVALVNSIATRDANAIGDRQTAERYSKQALKLNHAALGSGIAVIVITIISIVVVFTIPY